MRRAARTLAIVLILSAILPAAESAKSLYKKGVNAEARQDYVAAYKFYKAAYDAKPTELRYRVPFERTRLLASASMVHQGQKLREQGKLQDALNLFEQAAAIDPSNDIAAQEIRETQEQMAREQGGKPRASRQKTEDPFQQRLEEATGPAELQAPLLSTPISALEMTEDSKVIYETLGKLGGLNVLFDPDYTSRRLTIRLQKVNLSEALDIVALESRTFWRPVTNNTIFVAQDTQAKRRELEQNVVKTFYLGNVSGPTDLQDIVNAIRTVLEVQRIQQIPSQNAIVVKGTPDQLALAEKMIDDIDKGKPEVVVDVVVAQVRRDKVRDLGILPPQNASAALQGTTNTSTNNNGSNTGGSNSTSLNFNDLQHLNSTNYAVQIDPVSAKALFNDTDTKILQRPSIRASDNEKAQLKIADKIPIATGSFGTPVGVGAAVGAVGVNTQFTYTDVGVILEITPRVHPDGEVTLKTVMEISNLNGSSNIGGITQPIISTRRVEHTIRLKDGEMNLLGGILEVDDTKTRTGTPFLGEIPILRYIFSQEHTDKTTNEIVFLLVPHIVRRQTLSDINERAYDVGTGGGIDLHVAARPPRTEATEEAAAPAPAQPAPAPVTSNPVRPAPVTPRPVQPAANPANAEAPGMRPGGPAPTTPANTSAKPSPNVPGGPLTLRLDPGALTQQQGSSFTLNVTLAHAQDVAAVPVQITYDPRVLQFVSISNGDFLAKDGQAVALVHRDDPSSGKLQVTAQRPPGLGGVSGDGTVFSLVFMAKAKGNGAVAISIPGARNSHNQPLDVMGSQTAVTVN